MRTFLGFVIFALFLICAGNIRSATTQRDEPTDFRGIKWGASEDEARAGIEAFWKKRREAVRSYYRPTLRSDTKTSGDSA
jgi:hypothetical protein